MTAAMPAASAQKKKTEQTDSLVRLMKASSLELQEKFGHKYRKTVDATFLHNGTYLICDTALWNVDTKIINCWGHVQLIQDETVLTSDKLDYRIDDDLAQFRGKTVQLRNKKNNILRTRNLDYNTRDSIAIFRGGASMRDEDGQVIESMEGTYFSASKLFTFKDRVNMYTDSVFVKTTDLVYDGEAKLARFVAKVDFWKDENMLSASRGWYQRDQELFFFEDDVHGLSQNQEVWCDSLYFYRIPQNVLMLGRVHVQDTSRHVAGMANYMFYEDTLARVIMRDDAAVAMRTEQDNNGHKVDTLYMGADSIVYYTLKMCDIPESVVKDAAARLEEMESDPVSEFRRKAAEEAAKAAAKAAEEAAKNDPNRRGAEAAKNAAAADSTAKQVPPVADKAPVADKTPVADKASAADRKAPAGRNTAAGMSPADSLGASMDSLSVGADSLSLADTLAVEPPKDTTKVGFLVGVGKVRLFRSDMQVRCDSLRYCDLDSIARFYINPYVWNDGNRQYTSDSLSVLVRNGGVDRASLSSNALIITQEDSLYFDQIKGTDVMAYFDTTSALRRFDALGGATALFFLTENDEIATVNKVESKMLSALMDDEGQLDRVFYFESPKNDAYPIVQLPKTDLRMKGFNWNPDDRPKGREDITSMKVKPTERGIYERRPKASFRQTDIYFPGYMKSVYDGLEAERQRKRDARRARQEAEEAAKAEAGYYPSDSLAPVDSLIAAADSIIALEDRLAAEADSLAALVQEVSDTVDVQAPVAEDLPEDVEAGSVDTADTLATEAARKPAVADSLTTAVDSLIAGADSLNLSPEELERLKAEALKKAQKDSLMRARYAAKVAKRNERLEKEAEREEIRKLAIARRDAKWAVLDSLDAAKEAARNAKKQDAKRARTRRAVIAQMQQDDKDNAKLEKYLKRFQKRKARQDARAAAKAARKHNSKPSDNEQQESVPSGKRTPEAPERGDLQTPVDA